MISTVTTSTVTVVTTVAVASSLALVSMITLLILLVQREVIVRFDSVDDLDSEQPNVSETLATGERLVQQRTMVDVLGRALVIGILPLLMAFILIVGVKVLDVLR
jgi:hypothetical protein